MYASLGVQLLSEPQSITTFWLVLISILLKIVRLVGVGLEQADV